jgi:hypothetical protein
MILDVLLRHLRCVAGAPLDFHLVGRAARTHEGVGEDHDPTRHGAGRIVECQATDVTLDGLGSRVVDRDDLRAEAGRRDLRSRIDHACNFGVDAVAGAATGLGGNVYCGGVPADQPAVGRDLDRHLLQFVGRVGALEVAARDDVAIGNRCAARRHGAVARAAGSLVDAEQSRPFLDEGDASRRGGLAQRQETLPHRPAAAGDHEAPLRIGIDIVEPDLVPVGFEFIGDDPGERGADMLAHLRLGDADGDGSLVVDAVPDRWRERCRIGGAAGGTKAHDDSAARGADDEAAPRQRATRQTVDVSHRPNPSIRFAASRGPPA